MSYFVYILKCADGTLYAGSTNDIRKRVREHNASKRGARYTKMRRPVVLVYRERCATREAALRREAELKRLPREKKQALIGSHTS